MTSKLYGARADLDEIAQRLIDNDLAHRLTRNAGLMTLRAIYITPDGELVGKNHDGVATLWIRGYNRIALIERSHQKNSWRAVGALTKPTAQGRALIEVPALAVPEKTPVPVNCRRCGASMDECLVQKPPFCWNCRCAQEAKEASFWAELNQYPLHAGKDDK